jgi:SAM-dependent methyltransferase
MKNKSSGTDIHMTKDDAKHRLYDVYAKTMGWGAESLELMLLQYDHFWRHVLPSDRSVPILDIGCGNGSFLLYLKRTGFTALFGVDVSRDQVSAAQCAGVPEVVQADTVEYLAEYESYFGVISAQNILEHLKLEELLVLLDAAHKALYKGGELWIVVPNALSPLGISVRYGDLTHETCYTPQSLIQALTVCGFGDCRVYEIGTPIVHGLKSFVRLVLWKVIRFVLKVWRLVEFGEIRPAAVFTHDMQVVARKV